MLRIGAYREVPNDGEAERLKVVLLVQMPFNCAIKVDHIAIGNTAL